MGYWTHFLLGALVGLLFVGLRGRRTLGSLWLLAAAALLSYQTLDYCFGSEDVLSAEWAFARDVVEYLLGAAFVVAGSAVERMRPPRRPAP